MSSGAGIIWPWLRRIKVTFTGLSSGGSKEFISTGKPDGLRITAMVRKTIQGIPAATNLVLYNLSKDTRGSFQRDKTKVKIEAGWDEGPRKEAGKDLVECFYGSLLSCVHNRRDSEIITTIHAMSMLSDLSRAEIRKTWAEGTPARTVAQDLANELKPSDIVGLDTVKGVVSFRGWSYGGSVHKALDELSREFSFSWRPQRDGVIQFTGDPVNLGLCATIKDPYLIDLNPILSGPLQIAIGIKVRCTFEANLEPGYNLGVESKISPKFNGQDYRISSVIHSLDCYTKNSFISEVVAFLPPGDPRGL